MAAAGWRTVGASTVWAAATRHQHNTCLCLAQGVPREWRSPGRPSLFPKTSIRRNTHPSQSTRGSIAPRWSLQRAQGEVTHRRRAQQPPRNDRRPPVHAPFRAMACQPGFFSLSTAKAAQGVAGSGGRLGVCQASPCAHAGVVAAPTSPAPKPTYALQHGAAVRLHALVPVAQCPGAAAGGKRRGAVPVAQTAVAARRRRHSYMML